MAVKVSDETMEFIEILSKLSLSQEEKEQAKKDMEQMLACIDKLNELDTQETEPLSHIFSYSNAFREDVITNGNEREAILLNAPEQKEGSFKVPKTVQ